MPSVSPAALSQICNLVAVEDPAQLLNLLRARTKMCSHAGGEWDCVPTSLPRPALMFWEEPPLTKALPSMGKSVRPFLLQQRAQRTSGRIPVGFPPSSVQRTVSHISEHPHWNDPGRHQPAHEPLHGGERNPYHPMQPRRRGPGRIRQGLLALSKGVVFGLASVGALSVGQYLGGHVHHVAAAQTPALAGVMSTPSQFTRGTEVDVAPTVQVVALPQTSIRHATPPAQAPATKSAKASSPFRDLCDEARHQLTAGRLDEGIATAERAVAEDPSNADGYILLGAGLEDRGKWSAAKKVFRQSTRERPGAPSLSVTTSTK